MSNYKLAPIDCNHIHLDYRPNREAARLIVCLDCGAFVIRNAPKTPADILAEVLDGADVTLLDLTPRLDRHEKARARRAIEQRHVRRDYPDAWGM